jgi:GntR family transcriptional regulator
MLHLQIDPHSGVPVYRQVMDQTKYYVASGSLKGGDLLPSIRDLSRTLGVNPTTVVKAYTELQHEGVIEMKQGKGAFVSSPSTKLTQAQQRKALQRLARQLAVEATQMGANGELVLQIVQQELEAMKNG